MAFGGVKYSGSSVQNCCGGVGFIYREAIYWSIREFAEGILMAKFGH
jgi:hypothetical protein